jgi:hypothetical protein
LKKLKSEFFILFFVNLLLANLPENVGTISKQKQKKIIIIIITVVVKKNQNRIEVEAVVLARM